MEALNVVVSEWNYAKKSQPKLTFREFVSSGPNRWTAIRNCKSIIEEEH
jgi:hypothetical protein